MSVLEGLLLHEIVFLFLGILLFLVLLFVLVYYVMNKRAIKSLPFFFVIPVIMIGWPSIEKIKFDKGVLEIEKYRQILAQNPSDRTAREELAKAVDQIEKRPISKSSTERILSDAQAAIGDTVKAVDYLDRILTAQPGDTAAAVRKATLLLKRPLMPHEVEKLKKDLRLVKKP